MTYPMKGGPIESWARRVALPAWEPGMTPTLDLEIGALVTGGTPETFYQYARRLHGRAIFL